MPEDEIEPMKIDGPLDSLVGDPASLALAQPLLGDPSHHLDRPVDGCDKIDFHDQPEVLDRIDRCVSGLLVHLDGELIASDPGGRHADGRRPVLAAHQVERLLAESRVGDVTDHGLGHWTVHAVVDESGDVDHAVAAINQPDCTDAPLGQLDGNRLTNTASRSRDDSGFSFDIHDDPSIAIKINRDMSLRGGPENRREPRTRTHGPRRGGLQPSWPLAGLRAGP